jgi:hypothetical protein
MGNMTEERPKWEKLLVANRKKEREQRGGGKGGAGRLALQGHRANSKNRKCDRCGRWLRIDEPRHKVGEMVYCEKCAGDKGLI